MLALDVPMVLAGDYNVMPTDLDVYNPDRWRDDALFRPEVREAFRSLVVQGWTDALRTLHSGERIYTFWDYLRNAWGRNAGLRIDHLLLSPGVAKRLVTAEVDREVRGWATASDYAPAWIELNSLKLPRRRDGDQSVIRAETLCEIEGERKNRHRLTDDALQSVRDDTGAGEPNAVNPIHWRGDSVFVTRWMSCDRGAPCSREAAD